MRSQGPRPTRNNVQDNPTFSTQNLKVASVLTAMGFQFESETAPVTRVLRHSGQESTVFWFQAQHPETGALAEQISRWMTTEADSFAEKTQSIPSPTCAPH